VGAVARLYVGNLSYDTSEEHLRAAFSSYGKVIRLTVIRDPDSKLSKGFGFVEMPDPLEAMAAVKGLHGALLDGHSLIVQRVLR
jgi:RNA recognition motif-containing protein